MSGQNNDQDLANTIQSSLPSDGEYHSTDRITSKLVIEEFVVNRYEQAKKWQRKIGEKPTALISVTYLLLIAVAVSLSLWSHDYYNQYEGFINILFLIPIVIAALMWLLKRVFKNRASNQHLEPEEAVYHRLARAVEEYRDGNVDKSLDEIIAAGNIMEFEEVSPFSRGFNRELQQYINEIERRDSEQFYTDTFPEIANNILFHLSAVCDTDLEDIYTERSNLEQSDEYTPIDMFKSYIGDWGQNRAVRLFLPYLLVSPVIYLVYTQNQTLAQILAIMVVAIVQTYNRPRQEE